ncbi:protein CEPU-1-like [Choristoneura fumiferana]|uniref:protein CEPU-1-like n=1 Tax=Choristoneura fumiferana TaxID=7141 RepID=UPI003D15CDBA
MLYRRRREQKSLTGSISRATPSSAHSRYACRTYRLNLEERSARNLAKATILSYPLDHLLHLDTPILTALGLEPDFLYPLENVTIAQGRDAMFTCVVNNLGGYRVAWIKADTKAILAIHEHVITNNARLSVTHNDYNTWTLNIRGVKREDRGQYMCQVNTDPMKMQTAWLEVVIPPDINYEETSGDMMVPEGGSAKLVCKARGFPPPKILWRREDGGDLISRGGPQGKTKVTSLEGDIVNLTKVTRSEMGAYLCIAANGVPPSVSKRIMLHVHCCGFISEINSADKYGVKYEHKLRTDTYQTIIETNL